MCGIVVSKASLMGLEEKSKLLLMRGPDAQRKLISKDYQFFFNRLAIMGLDDKGMQPFTFNGDVLVANAEIYNEIDLRKKVDHVFTSGSDCEVLLPLYEKYGLSMFGMLDAEFAVVIYDHQKDCLIAGRDHLGIRPLFYGYDQLNGKIVFASEVKAMIDHVKKVIPFPPGHYYDGKSFIRFHQDWKEMPANQDDMEGILKNINKLLTDAVIKRMHADAPIGYLLSGGLDSSLVCAIAAKHSDKPIHTFSIGMDTDPIDLKYAKQVADDLKSIHHEVTMTKEDVLMALKPVIYALESYDVTTVRASIGMYLLAKYIHEHTHIKVLLTGEVSDELFGYKYTDYAPSAKAFQQEEIKRLNELYMYDVLRADRCLASNALEARVPFGDKAFVDYVVSIDPSIKMNTYGMGKYLLRKAFEGEYLADQILYREKAAFSDAVGHSMVDHLKAYAEKVYDDETFQTKALLYKPTLLSKEALLYREIFDEFYPGHVHLIKDYWMPNRDWEGCDVDDPSARFLKNYGDSGK